MSFGLARLHDDAEAIFRAGLARVDSRHMLGQTVLLKGETLVVKAGGSTSHEFDLHGFKRVLVFAVGKAAPRMALGIHDVLGDRIAEALVITKYGHSENLPPRFIQLEASHPIPDEQSVLAARKLCSFCESAGAEDLVIGLISGGASALAALPIDGITLSEKQARTAALLSSGAPIQEINRVRKSLSKIKGGKLVHLIQPGTSLNLILSDVIGDDLHVIASGLTVPEGGTSSRLLHNVVIGSNTQALLAAKARAEGLGYEVKVLSTALVGEAKEAAAQFFSILQESRVECKKPLCVIAGGETTVTLRGDGRGGRNQEMALAFLERLARNDDIDIDAVFLAASTDGTDGPTDAAGAFASCDVLARAQSQGLIANAYLERNDSYGFFEKTKGLFKTGPTGTNVCDLQILLRGM
ncbi:MAG: DUF4147 domain-containing protein [Bdellovibrionota bacterium]